MKGKNSIMLMVALLLVVSTITVSTAYAVDDSTWLGGILNKLFGGLLFSVVCNPGVDMRCNALNNQNVDLCVDPGVWDIGGNSQGYPYCDTGYGCSDSTTTCGEVLLDPPCCILGLYCDEGNMRCDPMDETKIQDCIGNEWVYGDTCPSGMFCEQISSSMVECNPYPTTTIQCVVDGGSWISSPSECCNVGCSDKRCVATVDECGICGCQGNSCSVNSDCCQYPQCGLTPTQELECTSGTCSVKTVTSTTILTTTTPCTPDGGVWVDSPEECCNVSCNEQAGKKCVDTVSECGTCGCGGADCTSNSDCCQYPSCTLSVNEVLVCTNGKCVGDCSAAAVDVACLESELGDIECKDDNWNYKCENWHGTYCWKNTQQMCGGGVYPDDVMEFEDCENALWSTCKGVCEFGEGVTWFIPGLGDFIKGQCKTLCFNPFFKCLSQVCENRKEECGTGMMCELKDYWCQVKVEMKKIEIEHGKLILGFAVAIIALIGLFFISSIVSVFK